MRGNEKESFLDVSNFPAQGNINEVVKEELKRQQQLLVLRFIIVYLISFVFVVVLWRSNNTSAEVVNIISIGSGLVSIGLAFIAIIYAFFQSKTTNEQTIQLHGYINKIGEQVETLGSISTEIAQFRTVFDQRMDAVKSLQEDFMQGNENMNKINELLVKLKPGNEDVIAKLQEEFEQMKNAHVKVSENIDDIVSSSNMILNNEKRFRGFKNGEVRITIKLRDGYKIEDAVKEIDKIYLFNASSWRDLGKGKVLIILKDESLQSNNVNIEGLLGIAKTFVIIKTECTINLT